MLISHFPSALASAALLRDGKPGPSTEMGRSLNSGGGNGLQVVITVPCSMIYRSLPHATPHQSLSDQTDAGAWGPQQNHLVQTWGPGKICVQNHYPCPKSTRVKQKKIKEWSWYNSYTFFWMVRDMCIYQACLLAEDLSSPVTALKF